MNKKEKVSRKPIAILLAGFLAVGLLAGCGQTTMKGAIFDEGDSSEFTGSAPGEGGIFNVTDRVESMTSNQGTPEQGTHRGRQTENVKLVYTANLRLQTIDYTKTEADITDLVERLGGYFEYAYVDRGGYYAETSRMTGSYVVRVPAAKFEELLTSVGETCHIVSIDRSVEDIGAEYFDTETRLNTLRTKMERLTTLLAKADKMSDIIELENSIANTQYEIDWQTSTLNRYDNLVGFSTVNFSLEQVARLSGSVTDAEGFFPALARSFSDGFAHFADSVQGVVLWFAYNLLSLAAFVAIVAIACKLYKKYKPEGALHLPRLRRKGKNSDAGEGK